MLSMQITETFISRGTIHTECREMWPTCTKETSHYLILILDIYNDAVRFCYILAEIYYY